jgi:putative transposase
VKHVQKVVGVSERRACRVLGQPRSTQRYESVKPEGDRALVQAMDELRKKHKRYGYRGSGSDAAARAAGG